jgi:hypothetical protein
MLIGDKVNWLYQARGGYGYLMNVAAVVTKIGSKKVQIRAAKRVDDKWIAVTRWVLPERLTPRVSSAGDAKQALALDAPVRDIVAQLQRNWCGGETRIHSAPGVGRASPPQPQPGMER